MIGVFDSGAGGLSIWKELLKVLPTEDYFYIADSSYCPYGPKTKEMILKRAEVISGFLIERGAEIIVVACNTATAAAIDELRKRFDIPFVGMEPAVKPAVLLTKTGVIGVLATQGTFKGNLYLATSEKYAHRRQVKIIEKVGDGLVELVEQGKMDTPEAEGLIRKYIEPMLEAGADCVVLGCTHYPFLEKVVRQVSSDKLIILNPAPAVAKRAFQLLQSVRKEPLNTNFAGKELMPSGINIIATTGSYTDVLKELSGKIVEEVSACGLLNESEIIRIRQNKILSLDI